MVILSPNKETRLLAVSQGNSSPIAYVTKRPAAFLLVEDNTVSKGKRWFFSCLLWVFFLGHFFFFFLSLNTLNLDVKLIRSRAVWRYFQHFGISHFFNSLWFRQALTRHLQMQDTIPSAKKVFSSTFKKDSEPNLLDSRPPTTLKSTASFWSTYLFLCPCSLFLAQQPEWSFKM